MPDRLLRRHGLLRDVLCADPFIDSALPQVQSLSINDGKSFGSFTGDIAACTCGASMVKHSFTVDVATLGGYNPGGKNEIEITGPNRCLGLSPLTEGGAVAKITVSYDRAGSLIQ